MKPKTWLVLVLLLLLGSERLAQAAPAVRVGSKRFVESYILAEIVTQLVKAEGASAEHQLGLGGTAVVFRATHRNGNRVAVKLLHNHLCKSRDVTRRFMREAYLANLLEHPGIVRVLDDDVDQDGVAFLVGGQQ